MGGTSGGTGAGAASTGDANLPSAVELTLLLARDNAAPATYKTLIPLVTPQPQSGANTQTNPGTAGPQGGQNNAPAPQNPGGNQPPNQGGPALGLGG